MDVAPIAPQPRHVIACLEGKLHHWAQRFHVEKPVTVPSGQLTSVVAEKV